MEIVTKLAWLSLAAIHFTPSLPLFRPALLGKLYGVDPSGPLGLLLTHRAGLFLAVFAVAILAALDPGARRAAALMVGISVVSFLILYAKAGMPAGPIRTIAIVDLVGIVPLAWVVAAALRDVRA